MAIWAFANTVKVFGFRAELGTTKSTFKEQLFRTKEANIEEAERVRGYAPEEHLCIIIGEAGSCCRPGAAKALSRSTWIPAINGSSYLGFRDSSPLEYAAKPRHLGIGIFVS